MWNTECALCWGISAAGLLNILILQDHRKSESKVLPKTHGFILSYEYIRPIVIQCHGSVAIMDLDLQ